MTLTERIEEELKNKIYPASEAYDNIASQIAEKLFGRKETTNFLSATTNVFALDIKSGKKRSIKEAIETVCDAENKCEEIGDLLSNNQFAEDCYYIPPSFFSRTNELLVMKALIDTYGEEKFASFGVLEDEVSWFMFETNFGNHPMEVSFDDKEYTVDSVDAWIKYLDDFYGRK